MSKHIGIVGCSAEGAALCYTTICTEGARSLGGYAHPQVSIHTHSLAQYVDCLRRNDLEGISELMLSSAHKLAAGGAELLICPDNTIHTAFSHVRDLSPVPWLHIAKTVATEAKARGYRCLGLLGTRWLVESSVYPVELGEHGIACVRPSPSQIEVVDAIIMDELVCGIQRPEPLRYLQQTIRSLASAGCDAVVLGCTELPIVLKDSNSALPVLDSTRLLAHAALRASIET
jgi:aspartate racemase